MNIIDAEEIIYQLNNICHLVYTPVGQTIPINCLSKTSEKFLQRGVSKFQLDPGCKTSLQHHYLFADESIAKDSGLKHITLTRESQMGIPHITAVDLEEHLQNMKTNGQYQPTVKDIVKAQQQTEELASKTSLLWSIIVWSIVCHNYYFVYCNVLLHLFLSILSYHFPVRLKNQYSAALASLPHKILLQPY
jgi:hypothetical protein